MVKGNLYEPLDEYINLYLSVMIFLPRMYFFKFYEFV
jgi:hypothetical protein